MHIAVPIRIIRVRYKEGTTGLFFATSPDLKGLLVAKQTVDEQSEAIPPAIRDLLAADGIDGDAPRFSVEELD